jgi:uncharacterized lipoprotein YehR (DUF1307 family)
MEVELKQHLEGMEARLREHVSKVETKLREHVSIECEKVETKLREHVSKVETRMREHVSIECEKVETKLLTEFHKWGRTADMRTRQAITDTGLLGERMLAVEDRISALERARGM